MKKFALSALGTEAAGLHQPQRPRRRALRARSAFSLAMLAMAGAALAQQSTEIGKITVTGEGDRLDYLANSGSGSSINITGSATGPTVYGGAPRFASVTLQSDF